METTRIEKIKKRPTALTLFIFLVMNLVISLCYLFLVRAFNYSFQVNGSPSFALSPEILLWVTFGMIILMGLVPYFLFNISNYETDRYGLKLNYTLFYIHFLFFVLWAFFTYTLALPVVGIIFLGLAIALGVYVIYRFTTNTIVGGSLLTIWGLWLIYLFILNLAYLLVI